MSVLQTLSAVLPSILDVAPKLLYARRETHEGVERIVLRLHEQDESTILPFLSRDVRDSWWDTLCEFMKQNCSPSCFLIGNVLIQPGYLLTVYAHSNEVSHFVIFDFGNDRNVWIGYRDRAVQLKVCETLKLLFADSFAVYDFPSPTLQ